MRDINFECEQEEYEVEDLRSYVVVESEPEFNDDNVQEVII